MRFPGGAVLLVAAAAAAGTATAAHDDDEPNPFVEAATALLQEHLQGKGGGAGGGGGGLAAVGGLVQSFMQSDGGRQLSDALLSAGGGGGGAGGAGGGGADLLSGLGSLLATAAGGQGGGGGAPGLDPQLVGSVVNMFASQMGAPDDDVGHPKSKRPKKAAGGGAGGVDWGGVLQLAGSLLASQQGGGGANRAAADGAGMEGLLNLLPMLLQPAAPGEAEDDSEGEAEGGAAGRGAGARPSLFAPLVDVASDYWSHFTKSEFGQTLWKTSGLGATAKLFTDEEGKFDMERIYRSLENASFRKRWIKNLTAYIADWVAHVSDPATQTRFLSTAQFMGNSFLKAQGYPKAALFDPAKPSESLSRMVNAVLKRQFNLKVNSATYIKPAVSYLQEVYSLGQAQGLSFSHLSSKQIEGKLTETINSEVIEPALRVWRAYRYAVKEPQCDKYVICFVNKRNDEKLRTGLKPGVTKVSSLVAAWYLSDTAGTSFWELYNAATEEQDCLAKYPVNCDDFHAEDIKATTEYAHSEL